MKPLAQEKKDPQVDSSSVTSSQPTAMRSHQDHLGPQADDHRRFAFRTVLVILATKQHE